MSIESSSQITTCLFLGIRQTPDVGMALNQSKEWAQDQIAPPSEGVALVTKRHQGKDYLGLSVGGDSITMQEIETLERQIREQVAHYCPKLPIQGLRVYAFAQVLVH